MSSHLQDLMCPSSDEEAAEVMFRINPRKYWRQYINVLEDKIESLEKQLAEKEAMIDWLAEKLVSNCIYFECKQFYVKGYNVEENAVVDKVGHINLWRKAAQEAVKKNDE